MSDATTAQGQRAQQDPEEPSFKFELHYGLSSKSVRDVLDEVLRDFASFTHIHNWDKKLIANPLETLAGVVRSYLKTSYLELNTLLDHSSAEEVLTIRGVNHVRPAMQEAAKIENYLFFSMRAPKESSHSKPRPKEKGVSPDSSGVGTTNENDPNLLCLSQGRIVYIPEQASFLKRASLLMLYTFCIRLQYEDYGYIRAFLERHLSLRNVLKMPYHWQQTSPPELSSSRQRCYRRVALSFHITYLTLDSNENPHDQKDIFDRASLYRFILKAEVNNLEGLHLFKASCSILLTLAIPEDSESHDEEIRLLQDPQALWTVVVINSPPQFTSDHEPAQHSTPIAQFIRGITSSVCTQRMNAQYIYDALRDELKNCDDHILFDDEHFTKSTVYHLAIKTCGELDASIGSNLKFMRRTLDSHVTQLCHEAHAHERLGIDYWLQKMKDEAFALEDLQAQINTLGSQVQESRNALHGVTAVLEARVALQQGDRIKTLAYLATIYLPLTATSSLYSMSVLPESATFASFFVLFTIMFLFTILLGLNLSALLAKIAPLLRRPMFRRPMFRRPNLQAIAIFQRDNLPPRIKDYIDSYMSLLKRSSTRDVVDIVGGSLELPTAMIWWPLFFLYAFILFITRILPALVLRHCAVPEILYPRYQWFLFQYRHNRYIHVKYYPILVVTDIIRFTLVPAWIALAIGIVCHLMLLDLLFWSFKSILKLLCYRA